MTHIILQSNITPVTQKIAEKPTKSKETCRSEHQTISLLINLEDIQFIRSLVESMTNLQTLHSREQDAQPHNIITIHKT